MPHSRRTGIHVGQGRTAQTDRHSRASRQQLHRTRRADRDAFARGGDGKLGVALLGGIEYFFTDDATIKGEGR